MSPALEIGAGILVTILRLFNWEVTLMRKITILFWSLFLLHTTARQTIAQAPLEKLRVIYSAIGGSQRTWTPARAASTV